jgi:hypothetical protein
MYSTYTFIINVDTEILDGTAKIDKLEESNQALKKTIDHMLSDQDSSLKKIISLEDSLKMLKGYEGKI